MDLSKRLGVDIERLENESIKDEILSKLSFAAKPVGALGQLHDVALRAGLIQKTTRPEIKDPALLIFAGDHGITSENVSAFPKARTWELVLEFLNDAAPINIFARQNKLPLRVVDVGVDHSFEGTLTYWLHQGSRLFNRKLSHGTKNFMDYPALTTAEMEKAMKVGMDMLRLEHSRGCNTIGLGDVGVGNTTSASILCATALDTDPDRFLLQGSRQDSEEFESKRAVVKKALGRHPKTHDPLTLLTLYGGYEIVALVGAILQAAECRMLILIDGFVSATAVLLASQICPEVRDYCIFCSASEETGHQNLLAELKARPLLNLDLRMGEGSAVALAFPLVQNAVSLLRESNDTPNGLQQFPE